MCKCPHRTILIEVESLMKKIHPGETAIVRYRDINGSDIYIMARRDDGGTFFLYEVNEGNVRKIGKASSPDKLEEKFCIINEMRKLDE